MLKNNRDTSRKKRLKLVALLTFCFAAGVVGFFQIQNSVWTQFDDQILDYFYREMIRRGRGPSSSGQVVYLTITDETYARTGGGVLDRGVLAEANRALADLSPEAVAFDFIFARSGVDSSDRDFASSLKALDKVYLPYGFGIEQRVVRFQWENGRAFRLLRSKHLFMPRAEIGRGTPFHARRAIVQNDKFMRPAFGAGHISATNDTDGIYRQTCLLVKVDSLYMPTLALTMFLDYIEVPPEQIEIVWGKHIRIPALRESYLERDVFLPIDDAGRTFIPYLNTWGNDFEQMTLQGLLKRHQTNGNSGNLSAFFEGKFVFVGEAATGISDLGQTPLESDTPLVAIHAAMMNALLQNQFYRKWGFRETLGVILASGLVFALAAMIRRASALYFAGAFVTLAQIALTLFALNEGALFPLITVFRTSLVFFVGLLIGIQIFTSKEQTQLRNAFSKYVPEHLMNEILAKPELMTLGGEQRVLTVFFADLVGFTTISETVPARVFVPMLNEYFSEMTKIIFEEGGILDKYMGDAIMAEFGAPLPVPNHAELAVTAALKMQSRLRQLQWGWERRNLPPLHCRIGINTGKMAVGNMGSDKLFDYTVIGDAVNLAARLEGANRFYGTSILISESTLRALPRGSFRTRLLDIVRVKGKREAIRIFEVRGFGGEAVNPVDEMYRVRYEKGMTAYLSRQFQEARQHFSYAQAIRPHDPASLLMLQRLETAKERLLSADWDGVMTLTEK